MKKILVSGASGVVGYGILRSLSLNKDKYYLLGTSIYDNSIAPAFCDQFEVAPNTDDDSYLDWLINFIKKNKVDAVIPGIDVDLYKWNSNRDAIQLAGAVPVLNNPNLISLCSDKLNFYNYLYTKIPNYLIPTVEASSSNVFGYPYILKPKKGFGSKGVVRVNNEIDELSLANRFLESLIMQPLIGRDEDEYTVSAFFDKDHNLVSSFSMKRRLSSGGYTEVAESCNYDFSEILQDFGKLTFPVGPTNFQFRLDSDQKMKLLEINPRLSSSTSIRAALGYNESVMAVDYFLEGVLPDYDMSNYNKKKFKAVRYVEDYIFYESNH
jgi:carbamoyl-phosphate synthase large subunit